MLKAAIDPSVLATLGQGALELNPLYQAYKRSADTPDTFERLAAHQAEIDKRVAAQEEATDLARRLYGDTTEQTQAPESQLSALATPYADVVEEVEREAAATPGQPKPTDPTQPVAPKPSPELVSADAQARAYSAALIGDMSLARQYAADLAKAQKVSDAGFKAEETALNARASLEMTKAIALDSKYEDRARQLAEERNELQAAEEIRKDALDYASAKIADAEAEVADFKIDPKRIFPTAAHAFGSALAMALGSFGSSLTGAENTAFKIIDSAVQRDIAAQRTELGKLQYMVGRKDSQYQKLLGIHKNEREVETLMRIQADKLFELQLNKTEAQFGGMINQQAVAAMRGQLKQRHGANIAALATQEFNGKYKVAAMNQQAAAMHAKADALRKQKGLEGFKDADTRTRMSSALASKNQVEHAIKILQSGKLPGVMGGAASYMDPRFQDAKQYQALMESIALYITIMKSGAAFTQESYENILSRLQGYLDGDDAKTAKLAITMKDLESTLMGQYQVLSPPEKRYYHQVFGGPPSEIQKQQILNPGQSKAGAVGPAR